MKRFFLSGQRTFGNRGCEALVRSTVVSLRAQFGDCEFLVPSDDPHSDAKLWPNAAEFGVTFVNMSTPRFGRYWVHLQRLPVALFKRAGWPFGVSRLLQSQLKSVDAVIAIGGDNYSLDYRIPSLIMAVDKAAIKMDKPVILWGASVGPFCSEPDFVPTISAHLAKFALITVRESLSYKYLTERLALTNVVQTSDSAFCMVPEFTDVSSFWPMENGSGVVGINVSPLAERYSASDQDLREVFAEFIRHLVLDLKFGVVLVPHVIPHRGVRKNNDSVYMDELLAELHDLGGSVTKMPDSLNAAQIKFVVGKTRYFIGARTHATIAALSSLVPTISLAYSVKARGINADIFDSAEPVLPISAITLDALKSRMRWMQDEERSIKETLAKKTIGLRNKAEACAALVAKKV